MLPPELLLEIFSWVKAEDLCSLAIVCKDFCRLAEDDGLWQVLAEKDFSLDMESSSLCASTWKMEYADLMKEDHLEGVNRAYVCQTCDRRLAQVHCLVCLANMCSICERRAHGVTSKKKKKEQERAHETSLPIVPAGSLRKGDLMVLNGRPCRLVARSTCKAPVAYFYTASPEVRANLCLEVYDVEAVRRLQPALPLAHVSGQCGRYCSPIVVGPTGRFTALAVRDQDGPESFTRVGSDSMFRSLVWEIDVPLESLPSGACSTPPWIVTIAELPRCLSAVLPLLGLHSEECADFLEYWLPVLPSHGSLAIQFTDGAEFASFFDLTVTPQRCVSDILRVYLLYSTDVKARAPPSMPWRLWVARARGQPIASIDRRPEGGRIAVVEWGGIQVQHDLIVNEAKSQ